MYQHHWLAPLAGHITRTRQHKFSVYYTLASTMATMFSSKVLVSNMLILTAPDQCNHRVQAMST